MTIENKLRSIMLGAAIFAASNIASANEAKIATPKEIASVTGRNDNATNVSKKDQEDWYQQKKLINTNQTKVLIELVLGKPSYCNIGLDGFPQKYNLPADKRTLDGKLEKAEWIVNLSETNPANTFYFPCDRKAEAPKPTTPTPITPEPTTEEKLPFLLFSPGASYLQIFTAEDETYGFGGNLQGGSLSLTVQPNFTNWYWGGRILGYYGSGSNSVDLNAPATEGPLAGQLVMRGKNDYSLEQFGIGLGSMAGYMIPFDKKEPWGIGLELEHGIMRDLTTRKFGESSAQYINGNLVEGTNISNNSDDTDTAFSGYATFGLRLKLGPVCLIPAGGFRTDFSNVDGMFSAGAAYCPNKE